MLLCYVFFESLTDLHWSDDYSFFMTSYFSTSSAGEIDFPSFFAHSPVISYRKYISLDGFEVITKRVVPPALL